MINREVLDLLRCPVCFGIEFIQPSEASIKCSSCDKDYTVTEDSIIQMCIPRKDLIMPEMYNDPEYIKWQEDIIAEALIEYFENENWLNRKIYLSGHNYVAEWSSEHEKTGWIVDIGCGGGAHYPYYRSLEKVIGIDSNLTGLQSIRNNYPDAILIQGDICNLPVKNSVFSTSFSIYVLEHIYYLDDAILEIKRVMNNDGVFFAGLPCEGGLLWNTGRKFTSERTLSKRYDINYKRIISIEHCNDAKDVIERLNKYFHIERKRLFPFSFLPVITFNAIIAMQLSFKE